MSESSFAKYKFINKIEDIAKVDEIYAKKGTSAKVSFQSNQSSKNLFPL